MQMLSDVVAAIADWFSLVISRGAVAGKDEIVGVLCLLHTVQEEASHATSGSLFAISMPVAICPNQTLI